MRIKKTELAYMAGLFDGEGCVMWERGPRISITSCWPHHLYWIARSFGFGKVRVVRYNDGVNRTSFRMEMSGKNALAFMEKLRPFMMEKRYQADILIEMVRYPKSSEKRNRLHQLLKGQKKIDYGPQGSQQPTQLLHNRRTAEGCRQQV